MNTFNVTKGPVKAPTPNTERQTPKSFPLLFPNPIQVLRPDLILADYGPMTLTVSAWADGEPRPVMATRAAAKALALLADLAAFQSLLKTPAGRINKIQTCPDLVQQAAGVCLRISLELTGLAAVAGLVADRVLDEAINLGADRVIVNNGGDIALKVPAGHPVRVGLKTHPEGEVTHFLEITFNDSIGGVATSGWTGRSFSTGVADVVSVWARDGATADAAATWIASRTHLNSIRISKEKAKALDPESDIPLLEVTREVGRLTLEEKRTSLKAGLREARRLVESRVIRGAFLAVQGEVQWVCGSGSPEPELLLRK